MMLSEGQDMNSDSLVGNARDSRHETSQCCVTITRTVKARERGLPRLQSSERGPVGGAGLDCVFKV